MRRQRETGEIVLGEMQDAPEIQTDPRWNEFSLEGLVEDARPATDRGERAVRARLPDVARAES